MIERYTLPEMGAVWSLQNKFQKWLDVELRVCEVQAQPFKNTKAVSDETALRENIQKN
jgi:adenylosuccinate lyase